MSTVALSLILLGTLSVNPSVSSNCDVKSLLKAEPIPTPGLAIIFVPDILGSELINSKNETVWPLSLAATEAVAFRKLINILGTMVQSGFSLDKLLDIVESFGDNIFTLYNRLIKSGIIDATDLNIFPDEYVDLLNNDELTAIPHKVVDYIVDVPFSGDLNFRVSLYGTAMQEFEKMGFQKDDTLLQFGYDFRRSKETNVRRFVNFIEQLQPVFKRNQIKRTILIGHGNGGLIVRGAMKPSSTGGSDLHSILQNFGISIAGVVTVNSPLNGALDVLNVMLGSSRHPLISHSQLKKIGHWESFLGMIPPTFNIVSEDGKPINPSELDLPDKVMEIYSQTTDKDLYPVNQSLYPVYNIFAVDEDPTPIRLIHNSEKNVNRVAYGPGDGFLSLSECTRPGEPTIMTIGGHFGVLKKLPNIISTLLNGLLFDLNVVTMN